MKFEFAIATAFVTASIAFSATAQSSDALLNKLVEKGILTTDEAKQLKAESDQDFATAMSAKNGMPEWVTSFRFGGDFRGRFDDIRAANDAAVGRARWRYRLRAGVTAAIQDDFEVGLALISGDVDSGISSGLSGLGSNQSFQNNASKKGILLDQAYAKWSPLHTEEWKGNVTFGKMKDPFVFSPLGPGLGLGFDPDYTPEGAAMQLEYSLNERHSVRWINGAFVLDELSASTDDPFLVGSQLRLESKWSSRATSSAGVMLLAFANVDQLSNGSLPNANVGNWREISAGTNQSSAVPQFHFNPILADASVTYLFDHGPLYPGAFPVRVAGTYLNNPAAASSADNYGWCAGFGFGKAGRRGTWELVWLYKWLGANAIWEEVVDDDFGAYWATTAGTDFGLNDQGGYFTGTNVRGHIVRLAYSPTDFLTLSAKWYLTELIHAPALSPGMDVESQVSRVQIDALLKF